MANFKDFFKKAKERRAERTKTVSKSFDVGAAGERKEVEFKGTIKTSKRGHKTIEKLSSPFGSIRTKKKITVRGETLKMKKKFAKV